MLDVVSSLEEEERNGDGVGDVEEDDAGCDHGVEGCGGADVEDAQDADYDGGHEVRVEWDPEGWVDFGPVAGAG